MLSLFATAESLTQHAETVYWQRPAAWELWVGFVSSPSTLWSVVTLLALIAIWRHRQKRKAQRRHWDEEEAETWENDRDPWMY